MMVDSISTQHRSEYKGETHYFCAPGCKKASDKDPEKHLHEEASSHAGHVYR